MTSLTEESPLKTQKLALGCMETEYLAEKTFDNLRVDVVKSGLQKYIRRSNLPKALYCAKQLDLFANVPEFKGEKIRTNMIHRLMIIFLEDIGIGGLHLWQEIDHCVTILKIHRDAYIKATKASVNSKLSLKPHPRFVKSVLSSASTVNSTMSTRLTSKQSLLSVRSRALEISTLRHWIQLMCTCCNKSRMGDHLHAIPCTVKDFNDIKDTLQDTPFHAVYCGDKTIQLQRFQFELSDPARLILKFQDLLGRCLFMRFKMNKSSQSTKKMLTQGASVKLPQAQNVDVKNQVENQEQHKAMWCMNVQAILYARLLHNLDYDVSIFKSMLRSTIDFEHQHEQRLSLAMIALFQQLKLSIRLGLKWHSYLKTLKEQFLTWMVPLNALLFGIDKCSEYTITSVDGQENSWSDIAKCTIDEDYVYDKHVYESKCRTKAFFAEHGAAVHPESHLVDPWLAWFYKLKYQVADANNVKPSNTSIFDLDMS